MKILMVMALTLALVIADEMKPEARQMNWNSHSYQSSDSQNYPASSNYNGNYQGVSRDDYDGKSYDNSIGYDYQQNLPTPSGRFYSNSLPLTTANPIPSSYLRGMPRDPYESAASSSSSLANLQNGKLSATGFYQNYNLNANNDTVNRLGYDEDAPLGGISSGLSSGSMLSGTNMRNSLSRQDDFSYGTVNGGYAAVPPATANAYGYGSIPPVTGYASNSYASPGYSSNYRVPYGGYSGYGSPSYSSAGYNGGSPSYGGGYSSGYGSYSSYGNGYNSPLYGGYANGNLGRYGYGNSYGGGYGNSYGAGGYGGGYGAGGYGGGYGAGGYGGLYDSYELKPVSYKKLKKGLFDWFKFDNHEIMPHGYGAIPYDYYYDPPNVWFLSKLAFKGMIKSMFKPIFKWLPFCSPFFYNRIDRSNEQEGSSLTSALKTFLPLGLFFAAIVPNIITVTSGRRKRSEADEARQIRDEATFPILDMISSYGVRSLQEPSCQSKIVCEIGRMGGLPEANMVQRALWLTANYVPERVSSLIGVGPLFRQIRSQQCSEFICSSD